MSVCFFGFLGLKQQPCSLERCRLLYSSVVLLDLDASLSHHTHVCVVLITNDFDIWSLKITQLIFQNGALWQAIYGEDNLNNSIVNV